MEILFLIGISQDVYQVETGKETASFKYDPTAHRWVRRPQMNQEFLLWCWENSKRCYNWLQSLVGGLEHVLFSHILGIIIPIDQYVSEGSVNHQPVMASSSLAQDLKDFVYTLRESQFNYFLSWRCEAPHEMPMFAGWWFGRFGTWIWFFHSVGNNHPNWRAHIFQRGRSTTNQVISIMSINIQ